jgi:hypothetical protein
MTIERFEPILSPQRDKFLRFLWDIRLTEKAGVGAEVNFIRQELWNRDYDQYERSEVGFSEVPLVCGTNELAALSEWRCKVPFDINSSNFEGFLRLTVSLYDDNDHPIVLVLNVPLGE